MIKAVASDAEGNRTLVLGLSRGNTERLLDNKPISIDLRADLHPSLPDMRILMLAGETEDDVLEDLRAIGMMP